MEDVAAKYPEDHEATIFYALALAVATDPGDKTYADQLKAGAILQKLFGEEPTHPGLAHYIIHAYDVPPLCRGTRIAPVPLRSRRRVIRPCLAGPHHRSAKSDRALLRSAAPVRRCAC
jgi:hypothetical protein